MANELKANYNGTADIYAIIRNRSTSYVWNGTSFVAWVDADIASYDVALTSRGGDLYSASMPAAISEGDYFVDYYKREGATPAITDPRLDGHPINWSGYVASEVPAADTLAFWQQELSRCLTALETAPAGVSMITIDGQQAQYTEKGLRDRIIYAKKQIAIKSGTRRRIASIDLSGF
jgi:hypothetical protein